MKESLINIATQIKQSPLTYKFIKWTLYSGRFALIQILLFSIVYTSCKEVAPYYLYSRTAENFIFCLCLCDILFSMIFGYIKVYLNSKTATKSFLVLYLVYAILVYIAAVTSIRGKIMLVKPDIYIIIGWILPIYSLIVLFFKETVKFILKDYPIIISTIRKFANLVIIPHIVLVGLVIITGLMSAMVVITYEFCLLLQKGIFFQ